MTTQMEILRSIQDAQRKLESVRGPSHILVGSMLRFHEAMKRAGVLHEAVSVPRGQLFFAGLPVTVSPLVPEHMGVVMQNGEVVKFLKFDSGTGAQDGLGP